MRITNLLVEHERKVSPEQYGSRTHKVSFSAVLDDSDDADAVLAELSQKALETANAFVGLQTPAVAKTTVVPSVDMEDSATPAPRRTRAKKAEKEEAPAADFNPLAPAEPAKEPAKEASPTGLDFGLPIGEPEKTEPEVTYTEADVTKTVTTVAAALKAKGETDVNGKITGVLASLNPDPSLKQYGEVVKAILGANKGTELVNALKALAA